MKILPFGVFLLVAALLPLPLLAQDSLDAEVRATVNGLFDAMRRGDGPAVRALFHPEARLNTALLRDGAPEVVTSDPDDFVGAVGAPQDAVWDERISEVEIRVDEPLAQAWMNYSFYLGETFSHCGVNAFQFVRTSQGWQILQITDTRRARCG